MIHVVISPLVSALADRPRLPFYLSVEEWVARCLPAGDYFFTWRVDPTVIFGRNQDVAKEVDIEYCRDHHIQLYRRRSGGGCVYADQGNIMISRISPNTDVRTTFADHSDRIADMLRSLVGDAQASGRNDVLVGGLKVSGGAFYRLPGRSIVHSTLLYDTNAEYMSHAITPSRSKLESHKVQSVQSRIDTLKNYLDGYDIDRLEQHVIKHFAASEIVIGLEHLDEIKRIEDRYYDLKWIFGRSGILGAPDHTARVSRRIDGVGQLNALIQLYDDQIKEIELTGDFFMLDDLDAAIFDRIKGVKLEKACLSEALSAVDVSESISGLSNEAFIDFLLSARRPQLHKV